MSTPTNDGGPAFPLQDWDECIHARRFETGMSLRDYFAAHAMAAYITGDIEGHWGSIDDKVMRAYRAADTMLKERNR